LRRTRNKPVPGGAGMSWDKRFIRYGEDIGSRYWAWMFGVLLSATGLMTVSLYYAPFKMLLPDFSPVGSVLAARETARGQAFHGLAQQSDKPQTQQQYVVERFIIIYRHRDGGNLLTAENLERMKQMEDMVLDYPNYQNLCYRSPGILPPSCQPPASVVNIAYASHRSLGGDTQITVPDRLGELAEDPPNAVFKAVDDGFEWLLQLLSNKAICTEPPHHCEFARSVFALAGPLEGYTNLQDRKTTQERTLMGFLEGLTRDVLRPMAQNTSEPLQIVFTGDELWRYELNVYIYRDALMTSGSFLLLFAYFALHTQSLVVSFLAVISIFLAFPTSYFIYKTICGCEVNGLTVMAMFVVLGVAADDIFIVVDNWRRSRHAPRDGGLGRKVTAAQRAGFVLGHAAPAMAITSATTISAFMTATLSQIPTIRLFGFFAAIVVASNYLLVCTFFLASMAMWENHVRGRDWCLRKRVRSIKITRDISVESGLDGELAISQQASMRIEQRNGSIERVNSNSVSWAPNTQIVFNASEKVSNEKYEKHNSCDGTTHANAHNAIAQIAAAPAGDVGQLAVPENTSPQMQRLSKAASVESFADSFVTANGSHADPVNEQKRVVEVFTADELAVFSGLVGEVQAQAEADGNSRRQSPVARAPLLPTERTSSQTTAPDSLKPSEPGIRIKRKSSAASTPERRYPTTKPDDVGTLAIGVRLLGYSTDGSMVEPTIKRRASSIDDLATYNMGAPQRFLDRFFPQTFVPFANKYRRLLLGFFAVIVVVSSIIASHFQLEDKASMMLPAHSNIETFRRWTEVFPPSMDAGKDGGAVKLHFIWGIVGIDRTTIDPDDPDDHGKVIFNPNLDVWRDQLGVTAFCDSLAAPELSYYAPQPASAECSLSQFRDYRLARNLSWPMETRAHFYDRLSDFLGTPDGFDAAKRVGLSEAGDAVVWLDVTLVSTLQPSQHGVALRSHYTFWEEFATNANLVGNFSSPLFQTSEPWKQMATLDSLASTAVVGIVCSLTFATSCMLAVTHQWRLTAFAALTISSIVVTLVAAYVLMGRTLGFMESVNLAIVSGLAVDYTLHIAHLYQHSDKDTRLLRVQDAMSLVGISIFSGATTTLLASSMLFCAYIKMSQAFGATIFLSILFSFIYALGLFVPLLLEFGPLPPAGSTGHSQLDDSRGASLLY